MQNFTQLLFTLVITMTSAAVVAQNPYQLFRPDVQYLYQVSEEDEPEQLLGMRLNDEPCAEAYRSVSTLSDLGCPEIVPSFAGYRVCQGPDTTTLQFDSLGQLILLPGAHVGRVWTAASTPDGEVGARVSGVAYGDVLGLMDSVKSIELFSAASGEVFGEPIRISRHYGLVSGKYFYDLAGRGEASLALAGMSEPRVGVQNFGAADVLDVRVGDEWHYRTFEASENTAEFTETGDLIDEWSDSMGSSELPFPH